MGMPIRRMKSLSLLYQEVFDVFVDDGVHKRTYSLNRSYYGLYVPKGVWRELSNFSTNSLALILASTAYNAADYIRNYLEFKSFRNER